MDYFEKCLIQAREKLREIDVFCKNDPSFAGLSGWVFEQTIQHCIQKELKARGIDIEVTEQVPLKGRAKADLGIGKFAVIEVKTSGLFGMGDVERYKKYKEAALEQGFERYLYLTWSENHPPYKIGLNEALGVENIFYIENTSEWSRFNRLTGSD
ncbi:MAG: hypothetical protein FD174_2286 [Geobacteraceae bacterium]|nr:MAG: hypothetical protein FD174_2286 [Geobacteraceae bacterium]